MASEKTHPAIAAGDHRSYMEYALSQARLSPPTPTNYCVGAVLVDADTNSIISTGYSLELPDDNPADPGKKHAEQCCFIKVGKEHHLPEERICEVLPPNTVLYTTMEPCNKRATSNLACVDRVLRLKKCIKAVYVGIVEPETFVEQRILAIGRERLRDAGIGFVFVPGMEDEIKAVATSGHEK